MRKTEIIAIRPRRNDGEGMIGYLMRVAAAHGVPHLPEMLIQIGVPWFKFAQGRGVDVVAAAATIEPSDLSFDTGQVGVGGVSLRGETLRPRQWSVHVGRRACPDCLREDAAAAADSRLPRQWHRTWWDVRATTVCPRHRVKLIDRCRRCGERLDFRSTAVGECPRGHALADQVGASVGDAMGDAYVLGRLGAGPRIVDVSLDAGSLADAIDALGTVGAAAIAGKHTGIERHELLHAGFDVFSRWPAAFDALLNRIVAVSGTGLGRWGAARSYGRLYERVFGLESGPIANLLKRHIRQHALEHGLSISRSVFGVTEAPTDVCSVSHAAARLAMGFERARRELKRRGHLPARTRRGTPIRIPSAAIDEIQNEGSNLLGVGSLSEFLGIGRTQTRKLVAAGVFGREAPVRRDEVQTLLDRLSKDAPTKFVAAGAAPLPAACRIARCTIDVAVVAMVGGDLTACGVGAGHGLQRLFVCVSDLRLQGKRSRDAMTVEDAARSLDVKWETMRGLVRLGLVRARRRRISAAAMDAFRRDYVSGARLARALGVRPRTLMKTLSDAGTTPAAAPPRCRQVFYRRADVVRTRGLDRRLRAAAERS
ncbi:TniQ family protein [Bradyrhizobium sp. IAR9]|uniref:TniQ family protein n=1 Tax=Bradyrhizobium sp. IAR9 TaxID=2663841 RepID=UPI0015C82C07|nr:TniQ family protein [Bradyrhizobium sp. IAR9]